MWELRLCVMCADTAHHAVIGLLFGPPRSHVYHTLMTRVYRVGLWEPLRKKFLDKAGESREMMMVLVCGVLMYSRERWVGGCEWIKWIKKGVERRDLERCT